MNLQEAIYRCMQNNSWPDFESRKETIDTWADFTKKLKEPVEQKYILDSSAIDPHWIDIDISKEMDWLAINPYIQNDIKTTVDYHKMFDERKEKDMNNGFKERAPQAVFFNKYLHRYEKIGIEKVIFNDPATIVMWNDHVKTVVKCQDGDKFDPEKGLAMAITKRFFGNQGNYCNQFKKWLSEEEVDSVVEISIKDMFEKARAAVDKMAKSFGEPNFVLDRGRERTVQAAHKRQTCHTCKHYDEPMGKEPCLSCEHYINWESAKGE